MFREKYNKAKADYHEAGRELKKNHTAENKKKYDDAKKDYHEAGQILKDF